MTRLFLFISLLATTVGSCAATDLPKPLTDNDFRQYPEAQVKLGRLLFYDRVLSGTYRVSCATCHNHDRASSNGALLDGKEDTQQDELAVNGLPVYEALKPSSRPSPTLFNLGAREFKALFSDGRVAKLADRNFLSPAGDALPPGLRDVLAVQALFPVVTGDEQVGTVENDVKAVAHLGNQAVWEALVQRVRDLPEYVTLFEAAFDKVKLPDDINIVHVANAIGAFVGTEWRSDQSAFDKYLRGEGNALSKPQKRGMDLFYGKANCGTCHSGVLQTDHQFHASLVTPSKPEFDQSKLVPDYVLGRFNVTRKLDHLLKLRTPSLRNVARTPPYGILGAVGSLQYVVQRHEVKDGRGGKGALIGKYRPEDEGDALDIRARRPAKVKLTSDEVGDLVVFLESLTDEAGLKGRLGKPQDVPSSLALD